jgi:hypothetical protein
MSPVALPEENLKALGVFDFKSLRVAAVSRTRYVVEGLIPSQGVTLVVGDSGLGKTPLMISLGVAVASGLPFLGQDVQAGRNPGLARRLEESVQRGVPPWEDPSRLPPNRGSQSKPRWSPGARDHGALWLEDSERVRPIPDRERGRPGGGASPAHRPQDRTEVGDTLRSFALPSLNCNGSAMVLQAGRSLFVPHKNLTRREWVL